MEDIVRDFKGVWIPREIWLAEDLSWMEKIVLTEMHSLDRLGECYASNAYLGKFFKMSRNRVSEIITSLKDKGYVSIKYVKKGLSIDKRIVHVIHPSLAKVGVPKMGQGCSESRQRCSENRRGCSEKGEENNTTNNTVNKDYMGVVEVDTSPRPVKVFPPTAEMVKEYMAKIGAKGFTPESFLDYYAASSWYRGKTKIKNWKACVRTWQHNEEKGKKPSGLPLEERMQRGKKKLEELGWT